MANKINMKTRRRLRRMSERLMDLGNSLKVEGRLLREILEASEKAESLQSPQMPSETPSSPDTETPAGTRPTSITSSDVSFHANHIGLWSLSAPQAIWDWLNSQPRVGNGQVVETHLTLTSKVSTPPAGSASPSTVEPTREGNGVAGSYDMKPFLEADGYPLSPVSSPDEHAKLAALLSPAAATEGGEGA